MSHLPSKADLADAADLNLAAHFSWVHHHVPSMRVARWTDVVLTDSGLRCDTFNAACRARFEPDDARRRVAEVFAWFGEARDHFSWWTSPADRPTGLGRILEEEVGLVPAESELAMAMDLDRLDIRLGAAPGELAIRRVTTEADLAEFARVAAANWSPPDPMVVEFYRQGARALLRDDSPLWFYLGLVEGQAIATAEVTVAGGVAGLYNISTVATHRRRAYGSAMTIRPLVDARAAGYEAAILQAAPDGVGIYRRIGFQDFGDIIEYKPGSS